MAEGAHVVVAVVVTYRPEPHALHALLTATAPQVDAVVVADNGSTGGTLAAVRDAAAEVGAETLELGTNLGIATAQNRGCDRARALGATHVLLLDQDSVPAPDMVERLLVAATTSTDDGRPVAAVGAVARDDRDGEPPFVYAARRWGPRRVDLPDVDGARVAAAFLIASGCLVDVRALDAVGPMRDDFFIDHVDLEWGVRARAAGWQLLAVVGAELRHELGEAPRTVPGRGRTVHVQSVVRNYYMVRNTVLLVRSPLLPPAWRAGYLWWLTKYVGYYVVAVAPRRRRVPLMLRGALHGALGRTGPLR
ncbi:glycosyltransferase family 2 protein [Cellulomonas sp. 179-A 9B4 NHS]|uniref:glycosyltransferase family 2 protein n=1 Tax=Cellulomonas sp. 179-A 9B4 NHS TaxID=3142379 RepID=UPI0039A1A89B